MRHIGGSIFRWEGTYGFVRLPDERRVFVHTSNLFPWEKGGVRTLYPGQRIRLEDVEQTTKGLKALRWTIVEWPEDTGTGLVCLFCNHRFHTSWRLGETRRCPGCDRFLIVRK